MHRFPSLALKSRIDVGSSPSSARTPAQTLSTSPSTRSIAHPSTRLCLGCLHGSGLEQVRQWWRRRVLMRPEAAFPYVFAAEGAQYPPKSRHAQRPLPQHPPKSRHAQRPSPQHPPKKPPRPPPTQLTPHHRKKADYQSFDLKSASALCFDRHPISRGISPWSVSASLSSRQRRH